MGAGHLASRHTVGEVKTFQQRVSIQDEYMKFQATGLIPPMISPISNQATALIPPMISPIPRDSTSFESAYGYPCNYCGRVFKRKDACQRHARFHTGETFNCQLCHKKFNTRHNLRLHCDSAHLQIRYPCSKCSKVFRHKHTLQTHEKLHDNKAE